MNILIWGAGAIGGTVGAYLARAGHPVTFVDREAAHVEAINQRGLSITGPVDTFTVNAAAFTPENITGTFEVIFLCVKAHHTAGAVQALAPRLAAGGYVLSLQNGLNELVIAEVVGRERTMGAFVNFGADYIEPGVIHRGNRAAVVLGELDGQITQRLRSLHTLMLDFDDRAIMTPNIWGYLWAKLAYGAQLFATALTNDSIADALANPRYQPVYIELARETLRVAAAQGVQSEAFNGFDPLAFLPDAPDDLALRSLDAMVVFNRGSAKTHSGIWRDLAVRKRPTEVDAQVGTVVQIAREARIPVPLLARLVELIHAVEQGERSQDNQLLEALLSLTSP